MKAIKYQMITSLLPTMKSNQSATTDQNNSNMMSHSVWEYYKIDNIADAREL